MSKIKNLYAIETRYIDREKNETKLYRARGLTWQQIRIFRETVFGSGLFIAGIEGAQFGDGFVIPPNDILKIYVYVTKEKLQEFTQEELR